MEMDVQASQKNSSRNIIEKLYVTQIERSKNTRAVIHFIFSTFSIFMVGQATALFNLSSFHPLPF